MGEWNSVTQYSHIYFRVSHHHTITPTQPSHALLYWLFLANWQLIFHWMDNTTHYSLQTPLCSTTIYYLDTLHTVPSFRLKTWKYFITLYVLGLNGLLYYQKCMSMLLTQIFIFQYLSYWLGLIDLSIYQFIWGAGGLRHLWWSALSIEVSWPVQWSTVNQSSV